MNYLPSMKIAQGEPFAYDMTVVGQDWSGWTGTATFKAHIGGTWRRTDAGCKQEPIISVAAAADDAGLIQFSLSAAETALFPALPRRGFYRQAVCEIAMTNGSDAQRFQAPVLVAAKL